MNKKNFKVVQITGMTAILIGMSLVTIGVLALVALPVWAIKELWNYFISYYFALPEIWYLHASLLWVAILLTGLVIFRNFVSISFHHAPPGSDSPEVENMLEQLSEKDDVTDEEIEKLEELLNKKK